MIVSFKKLFEAKYIQELESIIINVIDNKQVVRIKYKDNFYRDLEIYDYGTTKTGRQAISAYQINGGSQSGERSGWKIFFLDDIQNIIITQKQFTSPRPKWNPNENKIFIEKYKSVSF